MVRCEYCKKKSTEWRQITFHVFPKDEAQKLKWVENMGRKGWTPKKHMYLCSEHFPKNSIDFRDVQCRLRKGSIPTIFSHNKENTIASPIEESVSEAQNTLEAVDVTSTNIKLSLDENSCTSQLIIDETSLPDRPIFTRVKDNDGESLIKTPVPIEPSNPASKKAQDIPEGQMVRNCHPGAAEESDPVTAKILQEKILTHDHTYTLSSDVIRKKLSACELLVQKLSAENKILKRKAKRDLALIKSLKDAYRQLQKSKRLSRSNIYCLKVNKQSLT